MGSFWNDVGLMWDHVGLLLGVCWDRFGITLELLLDHVGIILGSFRDHVVSDSFGIVLGSI